MQPHSCQTTLPCNGESQMIEVYYTGMNEEELDKILQGMDDKILSGMGNFSFLGTRYILREAENMKIVGAIKHSPKGYYLAEVDDKYGHEAGSKLIRKGVEAEILPKKYAEIMFIEEADYFKMYKDVLSSEIEREESVLSEMLLGKGIKVPMKKRVRQKLFNRKSEYEI